MDAHVWWTESEEDFEAQSLRLLLARTWMKNNFGKKFKFYEKVQSLLLVWRMTMGRRSSSTRTATTTKEEEEEDNNVQYAQHRQFHWLTQLLQVVGRGWLRLRRRPVRRRMDEEFNEEEEESGTWTDGCGAFLIRIREREKERWGQGTVDPIGMLV